MLVDPVKALAAAHELGRKLQALGPEAPDEVIELDGVQRVVVLQRVRRPDLVDTHGVVEKGDEVLQPGRALELAAYFLQQAVDLCLFPGVCVELALDRGEVGHTARAGAYEVDIQLVDKRDVPRGREHKCPVVDIVYQRLLRTAGEPVDIPVRELEALQDQTGGFFNERETGLYGAAPENGELSHNGPSPPPWGVTRKLEQEHTP